MTNAYAFTDYQAQGQTILHVIVDIAKPPSGSLNLFNLYLYVALSRSSGRGTIRLLRDFDDTIFMCSHTADLLAEDDRLLLMIGHRDGGMVEWNGVTPRSVSHACCTRPSSSTCSSFVTFAHGNLQTITLVCNIRVTCFFTIAYGNGDLHPLNFVTLSS